MECYNKVISPSEIIDYSGLIISQYERRFPGILNSQPMVGFKILMRDLDAFKAPGQDRLRYIDSFLPKILTGNGCILRETHSTMPDGLWLITLPVPITQLNDTVVNQVGRLSQIMSILERELNIVPSDIVEVNISGRCTVADMESRIASVIIPENIRGMHQQPDNWSCKLGTIIRINEGFALLRTRWNMGNIDDFHRKETMLLISNILSTIFR